MKRNSEERQQQITEFLHTLLDGNKFKAKQMLKEDSSLLHVTDELDRKTALHWAVLNAGDGVGCIPLLLWHGLDPDLRDSKGCTALHECAMYGCVPATKALLQAGADPLAIGKTNAGKEAPAQTAKRWGWPNVHKLLEKHASKRKPSPA